MLKHPVFIFVMQHKVVSRKSSLKSSDDVFNTRNLLWLSTICLQSDGSPAAFWDFEQTHTVNINRAVGIDRTPTDAKRTAHTAAVVYIPSVFLYVSFWTHSRFISYSKDMRACTTSPWTPPCKVYRYVDEGMHLWMNKDVMMSRTRQPPGRSYILIQLHLGFFAVLYAPIVSHTFFQHTFFDFQIQMHCQLYHWIYLLINNISIIAICCDAVSVACLWTTVSRSGQPDCCPKLTRLTFWDVAHIWSDLWS